MRKKRALVTAGLRDDDYLPRIFASVLISTAAASTDESVILGETYEEVAELVARVVDMGRRLGPQRVVCVLDQHRPLQIYCRRNPHLRLLRTVFHSPFPQKRQSILGTPI